MKKSKKWIGGILSAICIFFCLFIAVEVIFASRESRPPRVFGYSISYVPTNSMEPVLESGDYIMFHTVNYEDIVVGDIIIYKSQEGVMKGNFIVHRVIEKNSEYLITKGDHNDAADSERITRDMVYGRYIMTVGILSIFSGGVSRNVIFFLLIFVFAVLIGLQFTSIVLKYKRDKLIEDSNKEKELLIEELKKEILEEELSKLRATSQGSKDNKQEEDNLKK